MESKYKWRLKGLAKGINPDLVVEELQKIEQEYGSLTAKSILETASSEESVLHPLFLWDDTEAARRYRLSQANVILNNISVVTVSDGQEKQVSVYEIVRGREGNVYKHIESFTDADVEYVKTRTIRELNTMKNKLSTYKDFRRVVEKISEALELL